MPTTTISIYIHNNTHLDNNPFALLTDINVKDGCGVHTYGFTSGVTAGTVCGGSAITPGSVAEISSL